MGQNFEKNVSVSKIDGYLVGRHVHCSGREVRKRRLKKRDGGEGEREGGREGEREGEREGGRKGAREGEKMRKNNRRQFEKKIQTEKWINKKMSKSNKLLPASVIIEVSKKLGGGGVD